MSHGLVLLVGWVAALRAGRHCRASMEGGGGIDESVEVQAAPEPELAYDDESEDEEQASSGDEGAAAPPAEKPRFKSKAELEAHAKAVEAEALADEATMKRLAEVRARREAARIKREEEEAKQAAIEAELAARAAAANATSTERPTLPTPGPKEVKASLMAMQEAASDAFQKKHGLKGAGGNKLAKIKGAAFKKIFEDFQENAETSELLQYMDELG